MAEERPSYVKKFIRTKTISESSEASSIGDFDEQMRQRSGSVNSKESLAQNPQKSMENVLYDKYLANFFNPLHPKPTGEGIAPEAKSKGVLYDVDGKFAYSTYSEEMRSYHPMLDIKALTKDLK